MHSTIKVLQGISPVLTRGAAITSAGMQVVPSTFGKDSDTVRKLAHWDSEGRPGPNEPTTVDRASNHDSGKSIAQMATKSTKHTYRC